MENLIALWNRQPAGKKAGLAAGMLLILALVAALGYMTMRVEYQVLFSDLQQRDAAAMAAELERMKVPYRLSDNGGAILVPKDQVHKSRMKLAGKDIPLQGGIGFEVFNNADFGMTDFVQKVNYQRAVQGELTRTLLSIEDVQAVRVHLAVPEQGLFKKATTRSKASVTLTLKPSKTLAANQITGIQRLVAASVADVAPDDVTVIDQHGVALTRRAQAEGEVLASGVQIESKRETEDYLARKINLVLENAFGRGAATAIVDVALSGDHRRIVTEQGVQSKTGKSDAGAATAGSRERPASNAVPSIEGMSLAGNLNPLPDGATPGNRRVEQTVIPPGGLRRMTVAIVIKRQLDPAQLERLKEVVGSAAGFNAQRGDAIVVYPLGDAASANAADAKTTTDQVRPDEEASVRSEGQSRERITSAGTHWIAMAGIVAGFGGLALFLALRRRAARYTPAISMAGSPLAPAMTAAEREKTLVRLKQWVNGGQAGLTGEVRR
ncbi:flagellar basal-body MS-ring/collar protein FliF [Noviherbaspirillum galbum]|uniref:Flagellar M-ring protein n=1 Tax=Noviherbaspirillum galbum TaxID=2709383 RepID=A0A6B3SUI5_9BURK|nr:flagellar basal-body MS-ring/collar protein FliF [Noviherbaspirillum galbum]NEX63025.1 flagellar M-ring protein FliF [Noviherbaspirillum galbum]